MLCVSHNRRSAGKKQEFEGVEYTIEELTENRYGAGQGRGTQQTGKDSGGGGNGCVAGNV